MLFLLGSKTSCSRNQPIIASKNCISMSRATDSVYILSLQLKYSIITPCPRFAASLMHLTFLHHYNSPNWWICSAILTIPLFCKSMRILPQGFYSNFFLCVVFILLPFHIFFTHSTTTPPVHPTPPFMYNG